jgi:cardiolipin synthase
VDFARHLSAAAGRGVNVRVLLDSYGAMHIDRNALRILEQNCNVCWFRPLKKFCFWQNLKRSHRKLLICDGEVGFTGGVGIAQEWTGNGDRAGSWRDSHFMLKGPIVATLRAAFLEGWLESCHPADAFTETVSDSVIEKAGAERILPVSSTASDYWSSAGTMLLSSIAVAKTSLKITTPYFVLDRKLKDQLLAAMDRGVDIQIIIPAYRNSDSHMAGLAALYCVPPLVEKGIRVYSFEPTLNHNKCIIVDDQVAIIGSVNFNQRSQRKDDEFSLVIDGGETLPQLLADFTADLESSTLLSPGLIKKRHKYLGNVARLIQPVRRHI